jgi:lysophospholipase L1-like esterase
MLRRMVWARLPRPSAAAIKAVFAALGLVLFVSAAQAAGQRVLVYGDSNSWGWQPVLTGFPASRLGDEARWAGVLQKQLGAGYHVIVDGLNGRTVDVSYPTPTATLQGAEFNGELGLRVALAREAPLYLIIIMLGTNDVQPGLNRTPTQIAQGISKLVGITRQDHGGVFTTAPQPLVLVIAPPPLGDVSKTPFKDAFAGDARRKSESLALNFKQIAEQDGVAFFDSSRAVGHAEGVDGVHLSARQHRRLGQALPSSVRAALAQARP